MVVVVVSCSLSRFHFVEVRSFVTPLYVCFFFFSIAPCFWHFLSTFLPLPFLGLSSAKPPILAVLCDLQ